MITLVLLGYQQSTYFVDCSQYCYLWSEQVRDANNQKIDNYVHWPLGPGEPYWTTNVRNPRINPSPFQKEILNLDYFQNADLTLQNIFESNLKYLLDDS